MKPHQIVIDTNVFVSGLWSRRGAAFKLERSPLASE
jgi:predicted nucleic acid-binding protein